MSTQPSLNFSDTWISSNAQTVLDKMRGRESFCADDLHGLIPEPVSRNHWGALVKSIQKHLDLVGYCKSNRPQRNGGLLRCYRVKAL